MKKTLTTEKLPLRSARAIQGGGVDNVSVLGRAEKTVGVVMSVLRPVALKTI